MFFYRLQCKANRPFDVVTSRGCVISNGNRRETLVECPGGGGGTLEILGLGCAARTLEPFPYTGP